MRFLDVMCDYDDTLSFTEGAQIKRDSNDDTPSDIYLNLTKEEVSKINEIINSPEFIEEFGDGYKCSFDGGLKNSEGLNIDIMENKDVSKEQGIGRLR